MSLLTKLSARLAKTRASFSGGLKSIFQGKVNEQFFEELEEALILADVGVATALQLTAKLRERARAEKIREREALWQALISEITAILLAHQGEPLSLQPGRLQIILMIGVNGSGKTTTIGKLAARYHAQGKKVLLAAADTYRAAAAEQLAGWAERVGVPLIRQAEGADPGAVVFDAIAAAKARQIDLLLVDTAGRLQNKTNLMAELAKIGRIIEREAPGAGLEALLVLDGGTGQNAISQVREFTAAIALSGLVITKLDGTAKGGAVIGIVEESGLPVRLIGVGEAVEDLRDFDAAEFAEALFAE
ncbi:MAG: signal recognition particle-docking protein FtsY [Clostridia bacterium]|nr:signal recognition particle-docking protein FtsY [Clostridia bacterium]